MSKKIEPVDPQPKVSRRTFLLAGGSALAMSQPLIAQTKQRGLISDENCVFCRIVAGKLSAFKVWEDDNFLAFLDHKPITPGHTLLIPKDHYDYLFEMPERRYSDIMKNARRLSSPLRTAMASKRIGVIVEGFGVNHCHVHLVPISEGGELIKKGKTGVPDEEFNSVAHRLRKAIGPGIGQKRKS